MKKFYDYVLVKEFTLKEESIKLVNILKEYEEKRILIIHHYDLDGWGSKTFFNAILSNVIKKANTTIKSVNTKADEAIDINACNYDLIVLLDCSFSKEFEDLYNKLVSKTIIIDHHASAIEQLDLSKYKFAIVTSNMTISATALCYGIYRSISIPVIGEYEYYKFMNNFVINSFIEFIASSINGWDTFEWKNESDRELYKELFGNSYKDLYQSSVRFNKTYLLVGDKGMDLLFNLSLKYKLESTRELETLVINESFIYDNRLQGEIEEFKTHMIIEYVTFNDKDYRSAIGLGSIKNASLIANSVFEENKENPLELFILIDLNTGKVGLRSSQDSAVNCKEIAIALNGGGHVKAAGFQINDLINLILDEVIKKIETA